MSSCNVPAALPQSDNRRGGEERENIFYDFVSEVIHCNCHYCLVLVFKSKFPKLACTWKKRGKTEIKLHLFKEEKLKNLCTYF